MDQDIKKLKILFTTLKKLIQLRQAMLLFFNLKEGPMALSQAMQQAIADLNTAIDGETTEIAGMIQAIIDKIGSGPLDEAEVINALTAAKTRIENISNALPTLPSE